MLFIICDYANRNISLPSSCLRAFLIIFHIFFLGFLYTFLALFETGKIGPAYLMRDQLSSMNVFPLTR